MITAYEGIETAQALISQHIQHHVLAETTRPIIVELDRKKKIPINHIIIESDYGSVLDIQSSHTTQSETMRQAKTMISMTNIVKIMDENGSLKTRVFHALGSGKKHASNYDMVEAEILKQLKHQAPEFRAEHIIRITDNCTAEYKSRKILYNLRVC